MRDADSRPIYYVSWHEALAYCEWLNEMFATSPVLESSLIAGLVRDSGWQVSLPSELEWEKAARGGLRDAVFPWGDAPDPNRANYDESGIDDTSAVGCFPANGFGLYDMVGNVWEWTRSLWGKDRETPEFRYPYRPGDKKREDLRAGSEVLRVMRGGSFRNNRNFVRCAFRSRVRPLSRDDYLGFRVVLRSAPVS